MRLTAAIALLLLCAGQARAQSAVPAPYMFGLGRTSCANWVPEREAEAEGWIFGFWSGINLASRTRRDVGSGTDGQGIIAEIKQVCRKDPSLPISDAITVIYNKLYLAGR